jgi:hypothetical protein
MFELRESHGGTLVTVVDGSAFERRTLSIDRGVGYVKINDHQGCLLSPGHGLRGESIQAVGATSRA